jgi:hypothetical protein
MVPGPMPISGRDVTAHEKTGATKKIESACNRFLRAHVRQPATAWNCVR